MTFLNFKSIFNVFFLKSEAATRHVEAHFPAGSPQDRAAKKEREQREFEMLRAQYGMDNQGNFREQSVTNMQRAVYAGEMSVADYYERTLDLKAAESYGIDDGSSVTKSIVSYITSFFFLFDLKRPMTYNQTDMQFCN